MAGRRDGVTVTGSAGTTEARAAVVAVGAEDVAGFTGGATPRTSGLVTWWFATAEAPYAEPLLTVDGRRAGPVQHAAVVSTPRRPTRPPAGTSSQATCLPGRSGADDEAAVRRHVGALWDTATDGWTLLARHDIPHAVPFQPAPLRTTTAARIGDRTYAAGDHRDTASIQGALVSGQRVARTLLRDLSGL